MIVLSSAIAGLVSFTPYRSKSLLVLRMILQVCEDLLERMAARKGTNDRRLELLAPVLSGLGRESAFPLLRLILPEVIFVYSSVANARFLFPREPADSKVAPLCPKLENHQIWEAGQYRVLVGFSIAIRLLPPRCGTVQLL